MILKTFKNMLRSKVCLYKKKMSNWQDALPSNETDDEVLCSVTHEIRLEHGFV